MPELDPSPSANPPTETLKCQACGEPLRLARIEPDGPGRDLRVFECARGHSETQHITYK